MLIDFAEFMNGQNIISWRETGTRRGDERASTATPCSATRHHCLLVLVLISTRLAPVSSAQSIAFSRCPGISSLPTVFYTSTGTRGHLSSTCITPAPRQQPTTLSIRQNILTCHTASSIAHFAPAIRIPDPRSHNTCRQSPPRTQPPCRESEPWRCS